MADTVRSRIGLTKIDHSSTIPFKCLSRCCAYTHALHALYGPGFEGLVSRSEVSAIGSLKMKTNTVRERGVS